MLWQRVLAALSKRITDHRWYSRPKRKGNFGKTANECVISIATHDKFQQYLQKNKLK